MLLALHRLPQMRGLHRLPQTLVPQLRPQPVALHALATENCSMNLKLRHYFLTGMLVWLPMGVTVWLLTWLVGIMDGIFLAVLGALDAVIPGMHAIAESLRNVPGLGVVLVALVVLATGIFVANIFGQWWLRQWSRVITRIPVVNSIYSSVKQVADTLFSGSGNAFSKALLVNYPHQGSWTIAFLTGAPGGQVARHLPDDCVSVYVPTTPMEMMYLSASSTLMSSSTTLLFGMIKKKPEVGLGVVGTYTLTHSSGKCSAT